MNEIKEFFNKISSYWDNSKDNFQIINELLEQVDIKENDNILDLGCGKGVITPLLYNLSNKKVIAMDIADKMIEAAKDKYQDINKYEFVCADFYEYQFKNKFDKIIIYNAYPHFLDVTNFAKVANSILSVNGKLVIMHSLSRKQLENHHQNVTSISRNILEPNKEYEYYKELFKLEKVIDSDDRFLMILKKQ